MIHLDTTFLVDAIPKSRRGLEGLARRWLADHAGEPLATMDLLIAATALAREASLLTANEAHFARVSGLRVLGYR